MKLRKKEKLNLQQFFREFRAFRLQRRNGVKTCGKESIYL